MARTRDDVLHDALQLLPEDRSQLIELLRDSLMTAEEREIEQAWIEEAERRLREVEAGTAKMIPGDEVFRRLREKYRDRPGWRDAWVSEVERRKQRLDTGEARELSIDELFADDGD